MPFEIIRNNIVKMQVDAIVCNGNRNLEMTEGLCGAVFEAAGPRLREYCLSLPGCDTGGAVVTPGFDLTAKYIIHTVGPHWNGGQNGEELILRTCYKNVLSAARKYLCKTVAVPLISSGRFKFPKDLAMNIAAEEIESFLLNHEDITVYLVVFSPIATMLGNKIQKDLQEYVTNEEYRKNTETHSIRSYGRLDKPLAATLKEAANTDGPNFRDVLMRYVDASGESWQAIYKRAGVGKSVASKINTIPDYKPSKQTALAFAVSLRLSLYQTEDLLKSFGAAFSPADRADNIVKFFILHRNYDIDTINEALYDYDEELLPFNYL